MPRSLIPHEYQDDHVGLIHSEYVESPGELIPERPDIVWHDNPIPGFDEEWSCIVEGVCYKDNTPLEQREYEEFGLLGFCNVCRWGYQASTKHADEKATDGSTYLEGARVLHTISPGLLKYGWIR